MPLKVPGGSVEIVAQLVFGSWIVHSLVFGLDEVTTTVPAAPDGSPVSEIVAVCPEGTVAERFPPISRANSVVAGVTVDGAELFDGVVVVDDVVGLDGRVSGFDGLVAGFDGLEVTFEGGVVITVDGVVVVVDRVGGVDRVVVVDGAVGLDAFDGLEVTFEGGVVVTVGLDGEPVLAGAECHVWSTASTLKIDVLPARPVA